MASLVQTATSNVCQFAAVRPDLQPFQYAERQFCPCSERSEWKGKVNICDANRDNTESAVQLESLCEEVAKNGFGGVLITLDGTQLKEIAKNKYWNHDKNVLTTIDSNGVKTFGKYMYLNIAEILSIIFTLGRVRSMICATRCVKQQGVTTYTGTRTRKSFAYDCWKMATVL